MANAKVAQDLLKANARDLKQRNVSTKCLWYVPTQHTYCESSFDRAHVEWPERPEQTHRVRRSLRCMDESFRRSPLTRLTLKEEAALLGNHSSRQEVEDLGSESVKLRGSQATLISLGSLLRSSVHIRNCSRTSMEDCRSGEFTMMGSTRRTSRNCTREKILMRRLAFARCKTSYFRDT